MPAAAAEAFVVQPASPAVERHQTEIPAAEAAAAVAAIQSAPLPVVHCLVHCLFEEISQRVRAPYQHQLDDILFLAVPLEMSTTDYSEGDEIDHLNDE